jgi:hypothetical protein
MTLRETFLCLALLALLGIAIAICGGAWGPSDLEMRKRASEPVRLQK